MYHFLNFLKNCMLVFLSVCGEIGLSLIQCGVHFNELALNGILEM